MAVDVVIGTRPEIIKMAPVIKELQKRNALFRVIHTGQHYDSNLSENFFDDLELPRPDAFLEVGSGSQSDQTARAMMKLETDFINNPPKIILVQGDTNTVLAGALAGVKLGIPVGHVEAGLRSYDKRMPEEYNRRVADHVADHLFAPTPKSVQILENEHVWGDIHMTGNTVIDAANQFAPLAESRSNILESVPEVFILLTAHRAENVDNPEILAGLVNICQNAPTNIVYPAHPRAIKMLKEQGLYEKLASLPNVTIIPPTGYFDFIVLMRKSCMILTDSGGIQEEATADSINKRVIVFRDNTERPEAVESGHAIIAGTSSQKVLAILNSEYESGAVVSGVSPFGDGKASERIVNVSLG